MPAIVARLAIIGGLHPVGGWQKRVSAEVVSAHHSLRLHLLSGKFPSYPAGAVGCLIKRKGKTRMLYKEIVVRELRTLVDRCLNRIRVTP
jgi:hypothetical protein